MLWMNPSDFQRLVQKEVEKGCFPIWEMAGDRGLELEEYQDFAENIIKAFLQAESDVGR